MTTISFSISTSGRVENASASERSLSSLGMKRRRYAGKNDAWKYIAAHNLSNGRHLLDFGKSGFESFRRAYGASAGWILGVFEPERVCAEMAANAGEALRRFFRGSASSGVIVLEREEGDFGVLLRRREITGNPMDRLDETCSLLLPTGVASPRIGDSMLFERIDLAVSHDMGVPFSVSDVLLTGEDGESIAGIGDADWMYVECLHELLPAVYSVLGPDFYDLRLINSSIFSAAQRQKLFCPGEDLILAPLVGQEEFGCDVDIEFVRRQSGRWRAQLVIDGAHVAVESVAKNPHLTLRAKDVAHSHRHLVEACRSLPGFEDKIAFGTILSPSHLVRFPHAFRELYSRDPEAARLKLEQKIADSLARFKKNHTHWKLIHFSEGREKKLVLNGESDTTAIQFCAPLYLTEEEERLARSSAYAVVELKKDPCTGSEICSIPSVLDSRMAISDTNQLRRGVIHNFSYAA